MGFTRINNDELKELILESSSIEMLQKLIFVDTREGIENISVYSFDPSMSYSDIVSLFDDRVIAFKPNHIARTNSVQTKTSTNRITNNITQGNSIHNTTIENRDNESKNFDTIDSMPVELQGDNGKKRGFYDEPLTYDRVYNYYVTQKMSLDNVCKKMGVPKGTMSKFIHDNNIRKNTVMKKDNSTKEEPV